MKIMKSYVSFFEHIITLVKNFQKFKMKQLPANMKLE